MPDCMLPLLGCFQSRHKALTATGEVLTVQKQPTACGELCRASTEAAITLTQLNGAPLAQSRVLKY